MSFQERLKQALENAPAKETYNSIAFDKAVSKPYSWASEGSQKRCVR